VHFKHDGRVLHIDKAVRVGWADRDVEVLRFGLKWRATPTPNPSPIKGRGTGRAPPPSPST
jgi:hypothetical protein